VVVIGAGTAGCVVSEVLSRDPACFVTLIEAGPDRSADKGLDLYRALADPERQWPNVECRSGDSVRPYVRGRGVGGTGAINGMVLQAGPPAAYDQWAALAGCAGWDWTSFGPTVQRVVDAGVAVAPSQWGYADAALARGASTLGSSVITPARLGLVGGVRQSTDVTSLAVARFRSNVRVRTNLLVRRVGFDPSGIGPALVEFVSGEVLDVDLVVVCAGAIESPALLVRSGIERPGVGTNLHDHPSLSVPLLRPPSLPVADSPVTSLIVESPREWLQVVPLNRTSVLSTSPAAWLCGIMRMYGRGRVIAGNDPHVRPVLVYGEEDERDRHLLRRGARFLVELLQGSGAESASVLGDLREDEECDAWADTHRGTYFHAAGTCRMGSPDDDLAVVDATCQVIGQPGLYVIDASIFPDQPPALPYATTVAVATVAAERLAERLRTV
jgi:choline dehydrogenase-like flavoprotein